MEIVGENGDEIIVKLGRYDLKYFSIERDYCNHPKSIALIERSLVESKEKLIEAKENLQNFLDHNSKALNNIAEAGTLVGILFRDKQNSLNKL